MRYKEDKAMRLQERRERNAYLGKRGRLPITVHEDSDSSDLREKLREYREHENVILDEKCDLQKEVEYAHKETVKAQTQAIIDVNKKTDIISTCHAEIQWLDLKVDKLER